MATGGKSRRLPSVSLPPPGISSSSNWKSKRATSPIYRVWKKRQPLLEAPCLNGKNEAGKRPGESLPSMMGRLGFKASLIIRHQKRFASSTLPMPKVTWRRLAKRFMVQRARLSPTGFGKSLINSRRRRRNVFWRIYCCCNDNIKTMRKQPTLPIAQAVRYLHSQQEMIDDAHLQRQHLSLGLGMVESAHKVVVQRLSKLADKLAAQTKRRHPWQNHDWVFPYRRS